MYYVKVVQVNSILYMCNEKGGDKMFGIIGDETYGSTF